MTPTQALTLIALVGLVYLWLTAPPDPLPTSPVEDDTAPGDVEYLA